jgi:hypothetical protein
MQAGACGLPTNSRRLRDNMEVPHLQAVGFQG